MPRVDLSYAYSAMPAGDLGPVSDVAQGIASADSVREVFRAVCVFASRTTPSQSMFVARYDPDRGARTCVYFAEVVGAAEGERVLEEAADLSQFPEMPLNTGPQSRAILTGEVVNTPDLDAAIAGLPRVDIGSDFEENPPHSSLAVPFGVEGRVLGAFEVQSPTVDAFGEAHVRGLRMAANLAGIAVENLALLERERAQYEASLRALGVALEYRDYETKGHTDRVVALSLAFAERLGLDERSRKGLRWGAYLHDLGKVAIPDRILLKPGPLTDDEYAVIRRHTLIAIDMCRDMPFLLEETRQVIRSHHERWDGQGYPDGLAGTAIPLLARMFSLVDVYDALTSERPYKPAWEHDEAVAELEANAGTQFDPDLVGPFLGVVATVGQQVH